MSEGSGPLINVPDVSKPATVLIEKVSEAIGAICAPWQMKRIAHAESEAAKIKAIASIQITELEQRALSRMLQEQARDQANIESITAQATSHLQPDSKPEALESDWLAHFFEKVRIVSDKEMQSLWARLLAEEANTPRSISRRTVELVSTLEKEDAHLFTTLCSFAFKFDTLYPIVLDVTHNVYREAGLTFGKLAHLDDIGLISLNTLSSYQKKNFPERSSLTYHERRLQIQMPLAGMSLPIGVALLSRAGRELAPLCGCQPVPGLLEYIRDSWAMKKITLTWS